MKKPISVSAVLITLLLIFCNNLQGVRRVALLGDSMTWIGGDSCQHDKGWSHYLKLNRDSLKIDVYARSGATWTNTSATKPDKDAYSEVLDNDNVVFNQVLRLLDDAACSPEKQPDLIIIFAGANDAWFAPRRPGIFNPDISLGVPAKEAAPSACTSLASSVMLGCSLLQESFPEAEIVLITPLEMSRTSVARVAKVGDIIEATGDKLGLKVLRADKNVGIRHDIESKTRRYTSDGVHTNAAGARILADYILNNLF